MDSPRIKYDKSVPWLPETKTKSTAQLNHFVLIDVFSFSCVH